ncbi:MAG: DUF6477 family protein [Pseudomonadota bacterium]
MIDLLTMLSGLKRPKTLIRAARIGMRDYRRETVLRRLLGFGHPTETTPILFALMEMEAEMNEDRTGNTAGYSPMRHVEVMIALMSEADLLRASRLPQASTQT